MNNSQKYLRAGLISTLLLGAAGVGLAACGGNNGGTDASDSGGQETGGNDAATDGGSDSGSSTDSGMDSGATDMDSGATDTDSGATDTDSGATDTDSGSGGDGGSCGTSPPPGDFLRITNGFGLWNFDGTNFGEPADEVFPSAQTKSVPSGPPIATEGGCEAYETEYGTADRLNSTNLDMGSPVTLTVGSATVTWNFNTTSGKYVADTSLATTIPLGAQAMLTVPGGPDDPGGTASLVFPSAAIHIPDVTFPDTWDKNSPQTVSVNVPAELTTGEYSLFLALWDDLPHFAVCAVPACESHITVPTSVMAQMNSGVMGEMFLMVVRRTEVSGTRSQPLYLRLSTAIDTPIMWQ